MIRYRKRIQFLPCIDFTASQTCALLSTFVCDEKSSEMPKLGEELSGPLRQMQDIARRIARVSHECKLEVSVLEQKMSCVKVISCPDKAQAYKILAFRF